MNGVSIIQHCTGGGAHKFSQAFQDKLGIEVKKCDELECLVTGLNFCLVSFLLPHTFALLVVGAFIVFICTFGPEAICSLPVFFSFLCVVF